MNAGTDAITLSGVSVRYHATEAVRDLTLSVPAGQWIAAIGPNGAGKTSMLRAIAQLVASTGTITVHGTLLRRLTPRSRARLVAYVPQQPELPARMSVLEYTLLGRTPYIGRFGVESARDREQCELVLDRLELTSLADRRLSELSGGELQRVVLARALAQDAPVLLLDEPTSALDLGRRIEVLELIDTLRQERGLTVLSALHDLTLAGQFADRLLLMSDGRLIHDGQPAEVFDVSLLTRYFGTEVRVLAGDGDELLVVPQRYSRPPAARPSPAPIADYELGGGNHG